MRIDDIIDRIVDAETPNDNPATPQDERAVVTNNPADGGGRTQWGIAERSNPQAWADGRVTEAEAREIYRRKYVRPFDGVTDERLLSQLVDWAVTSGPGLVTQKVQEILHLPIDGILGPKTLAAINAADPVTLNNRVALARIKMIGRIVAKNPSQSQFLNGWLNRAIDFFVVQLTKE